MEPEPDYPVTAVVRLYGPGRRCRVFGIRVDYMGGPLTATGFEPVDAADWRVLTA